MSELKRIERIIKDVRKLKSKRAIMIYLNEVRDEVWVYQNT